VLVGGVLATIGYYIATEFVIWLTDNVREQVN
jgi:hypothetical protein